MAAWRIIFVIMLLGAERTTDTSRRFRWLTLAVLVLAGLLLVVVGLPLVAGDFALPDPPADTPILRVVHTATDTEVVDMLVDDEVIAEGVTFGEASDYLELAPGEHTVAFRNPGTGATVLSTSVSLEPGDVQTAVAYGTGVDLNVGVVNNDLSTTERRSARIKLFNAYGDSTISLVDLGPDREFSTDQTVVTDSAGGELWNADGQPLTNTVITDKVLVEDVPFGSASGSITIDEGTHTLAYTTVTGEQVQAYPAPESEDAAFEPGETQATPIVLNRSFDVLRRDRNVEVARNTEQLVILSAERLIDDNLRPIAVAVVAPTLPSFGGPHSVGQTLFTEYVLPVQLVGILLLVAIIGAIVLTRHGEEVAERRLTGRRKVSRPLASVIATQTSHEVGGKTPKLPESGD